MVDALNRQKPIDTELEQHVYHRSRARVRALRDLTKGMFRTHRFEVGAADTVVINDLFPDRDLPITFITSFRITGATPAGLIFEFSDSTDGGLVAWVDGTTLGVQVGASEGTPWTDSINVQHTIASDVGAEFDLAVAVLPVHQQLFVWVNGERVDTHLRNSGGTFPNGTWAPASGGAFAAIVNGTASAGATQTGAPTDFEVYEPLSIYQGQKPRHFLVDRA